MKEEVIKALHNMDDESDFAFSVRFARQTVNDGIAYLKKELDYCKMYRGVIPDGWEEDRESLCRIHEENIIDIEKQLKFFSRIKKEIEHGTISSDSLYLINHLEVPQHWEDLANKRICEKYQIKI